MKDFAGNTLEVGDEVAYIEPRYSMLKRGVVRKVNEQSVTVKFEKTSRFGRDWTVRAPYQVMKIFRTIQ